MFQLIMVISALSLEINSEGKMMATSRAKGDPFKVAKRNGWTFETGNGTMAARKRCLRDVVAVRLANDPSYTLSDDSLAAKALGTGGVLEAESLAQQIRLDNGQ